MRRAYLGLFFSVFLMALSGSLHASVFDLEKESEQELDENYDADGVFIPESERGFRKSRKQIREEQEQQLNQSGENDELEQIESESESDGLSSPEQSPKTVKKEPDDKVYKRINEDGVVEFSDRPSNKAAAIKEEVQTKADHNLNVLEQNKTQSYQAYESQLLKDADSRAAAEVAREQALLELQASVTSAQKALEEGKKPVNEDWQRTVRGTRFLKPSYHERVKLLEKNVQAAQKKVSEFSKR